MEHSANEPKPRGAPLICVDVDTGEEVWKISFRETYWGSDPAIADGILVILNTYDNCIYAFGKGPTTTSVTVQNDVVPLGSTVLIKGTVMDISPGTTEYRVSLRFPNGVPALADDYMSGWMEHVYMQFPRPSDAKGVWVTFDVINPNGEWIHVGGTHTDESGMFTIPWKPPKEGLWTIVITFPGTKSYWPSYARTTILVEPAPVPITIPTPASPEQVTKIQSTLESLQPTVTALIALVVISIILGIANLAMYIKRK